MWGVCILEIILGWRTYIQALEAGLFMEQFGRSLNLAQGDHEKD